MEGLTRQERLDLHLAVIFAHTDPTVHPLRTEPWLRRLVDVALGYEKSPDDITHATEFESSGDFAAKGILDYTYALQYCHDTGAAWVMTLEDDIVLADGWLAQALWGLHRIKDELHKATDSWIYMRLFNQERSTGWSSTKIGSHHEGEISLVAGAVVLAVALILRLRSATARHVLDPWTVAMLCFLAVPSCVILFFQAGKASVLPPAPGVREEYFGCCSQVMLFPREQVPGLIDFLHTKRTGQVDLLINDYARAKSLARMSLYPVQAQHIG